MDFGFIYSNPAYMLRALKLTGNEHDAKDLIQNVALTAWRKRKYYESKTAEEQSKIIQKSVQNIFLDSLTVKKNLRLERLADDEFEAPADYEPYWWESLQRWQVITIVVWYYDLVEIAVREKERTNNLPSLFVQILECRAKGEKFFDIAKRFEIPMNTVLDSYKRSADYVTGKTEKIPGRKRDGSAKKLEMATKRSLRLEEKAARLSMKQNRIPKKIIKLWTIKERKKLLRLYPKTDKNKLAKMFGTTKQSLYNHYFKHKPKTK